ncbi:MAG: SMC-Scp complex subunit ScpB, partial [Clostridia bacterium]|nr:SMC-Scp complex subunit ScpB [Clostridia bacterium]
MSKIKSIIESLIFLNGEPLKISDIAKGLEIPEEDLNKEVDELIEEYKSSNRGLQIIKLEDSIQMCTAPENEDAVLNFFKPIIKRDLSGSALETLSIIAYKQPVTRAEIEDIRKVQCSYVLKYLQSHDLIKVVGKKNAIGHPSLYGTT